MAKAIMNKLHEGVGGNSMKKFLVLVCALLMLALCASTAMAATGKPGDTVTVDITFTANGSPMIANVIVSYDKSVLECTGATASNGFMVSPDYSRLTSMSPSSGKIGTFTFKIKEGAASGNYAVSARIDFSKDADDNDVPSTVSGGTVTVQGAPAPCKHEKTEWTETKKATCTEKGEKVEKCSACGAEIKKEEIPATGHDKGAWSETKKPTCTEKGEKALKCTVCNAVLKTEEIPATGHDKGAWSETKKPTCTEKGEKALKCTVCNAVLKTEEIPAAGHDKGKWVVTKKATKTEKGEKALKCTICGAVLKTEEIPVVTANWMRNQSACSLGIRFRDLENKLTNKWYMFTPVKLTEGEQTMDLIAANCYKVGTVTLTVAEGKAKVSLNLKRDVKLIDATVAVVPSFAEITSVEPASFETYAPDTEIAVEGDQAVLFVLAHVDYDTEAGNVEWFSNNSKDYQKLVEELKALMD